MAPLAAKKLSKNWPMGKKDPLAAGLLPTLSLADILQQKKKKGLSLADLQKDKFPWPEWNDAEVNGEVWDATKTAKEREKASKIPIVHFFNDPKGKIQMPPSVTVHTWRRPSDFMVDKTPVVIENKTWFDLVSSNGHLLGSEMLRRIICDICTLWRSCNGILTTEGRSRMMDHSTLSWKPWEHIYSLCKVKKGHIAQYNFYGKYVVKLYWMGCWRKIIIDDTVPFDNDNKMLLPATSCDTELWPILLAKAIIKLTNVDMSKDGKSELGELSVLHTLTGWFPETVPLNAGYLNQVWSFLKQTVPPETLEESSSLIRSLSKSNNVSGPRPEIKSDKVISAEPGPLTTNRKTAEDENVTDDVQAGSSSSSEIEDDQPDMGTKEGVKTPRMAVYASFLSSHLTEKKIPGLEEATDFKEKLQNYGLPFNLNHAVLVTKTRSFTTASAPSQALSFSTWKAIRRIKSAGKQERFVEIVSPFLNYGREPMAGSSVKPAQQEMDKTKERANDIEAVTAGNAAEKPPTGHSGQNVSSDNISTQEVSVTQPLEQHKPQNTWIAIEDFCKCFPTLLVYHMPATYQHSAQKSDLRSVEEKRCTFLSVDNLQPTEIVTCFSPFSNWKEPESNEKGGLLTAEPFSWKNMATYLPILQINTCATKAALVMLPAGRHVLRFTARCPQGYHIHLCSTVQFAFGEEELVMPFLAEESQNFIEQATTILKAVGNVIDNFSDNDELLQAQNDLEEAHCPLQLKDPEAVKEHFEAFNGSLHYTITKALANGNVQDMAFAIQVLTYNDSTTTYFKGNPRSSEVKVDVPPQWINREATSEEVQAVIVIQAAWREYYVSKLMKARNVKTKENKRAVQALQKIRSALDANFEEHSVTLLRYLFKSNVQSIHLYPCYEDEWTKVSFADYVVTYPDQPANSWFLVFREVFAFPEDMVIVPHIYSNVPASILHVIENDTGEEIERIFQKVQPHLYSKNKTYTFMAEAASGDSAITAGEWKLRLVGSCLPLPVPCKNTTNHLFLVKEYKDYYIPNDRQLICRVFVTVTVKHFTTVQIQTSQSDVYIKLQILDNEEEVASTIRKGSAVIPVFTFWPNETPSSTSSEGTTAVGKVERSTSGRSPGSKDVGANASTSVSKEAVVTKSNNHKYVVQASVLHKSWTLTDDQQAFVKTLKEQEKNEIKVHGKKPEEVLEEKPADTPSLTPILPQKVTKGSIAAFKRIKDKAPEKPLDKLKFSKEADTAVRKPDSKLFSSSNLQQLFRKANVSPVVVRSSSPNSLWKQRKTPSIQRDVESEKESFDVTKAYWSLHIVCDPNDSDSIVLKKDTERVEEIRAMKLAWESAEPGRAKKAVLARLQYIKQLPQKVLFGNIRKAITGSIAVAGSSGSVTNRKTSGRAEEEDAKLPAEFTVFFRKTIAEPIFKDKSVTEQQTREHCEKMDLFKRNREMILNQRELEKQSRGQLKYKQMEMYEQLQTTVDEKREKILECREEFRQTQITNLKHQMSEEALPPTEERVKPAKRMSISQPKSPKGGKKK
ncbi:androglobin-like [Erpetoichthys calabaricus]|uniref:androglobin-like n=1 Tax=Erpetoichthys calabaricus TaxID=27687 RepID=UPI0022346680|nr:androglobin-like [Erpetoichthys calabaricus]